MLLYGFYDDSIQNVKIKVNALQRHLSANKTLDSDGNCTSL